MKRYSVILLIASLVTPALAETSQAPNPTSSSPAKSDPTKSVHPGSFGAGLILGGTNGLSLKGWISTSNAIHARMGSDSSMNSFSGSLSFEHQINLVDVKESSFKLPFYVGGGGKFGFSGSEGDRMILGFMGTFGMSIFTNKAPVEIFMEANPIIGMFDYSKSRSQFGVGVEGNLGAMVYF